MNTSGEVTTLYPADYSCSLVVRMFRGAEAFSILSILSTLATAVVAGRTVGGQTRRPVAIGFGLFATFCTLVTWALTADLHRRPFCDMVRSYKEDDYVFKAGFALNVTAFVAIALGTLVLIVLSVLNLKPSGSTEKNLTLMKVLFVAGFALSIMFLILGANIPVYRTTYPLDDSGTRYTLFYREEFNSAYANVTETADLECDVLVKRFRAAAATDVLAVIFVSFGTLVGIAQVNVPSMRKKASILGFVGSFWALVSWSIIAATYWMDPCGYSFPQNHFVLAEGLGFIVTGFGTTFLLSIGNLIFA